MVGVWNTSSYVRDAVSLVAFGGREERKNVYMFVRLFPFVGVWASKDEDDNDFDDMRCNGGIHFAVGLLITRCIFSAISQSSRSRIQMMMEVTDRIAHRCQIQLKPQQRGSTSHT